MHPICQIGYFFTFLRKKCTEILYLWVIKTSIKVSSDWPTQVFRNSTWEVENNATLFFFGLILTTLLLHPDAGCQNSYCIFHKGTTGEPVKYSGGAIMFSMLWSANGWSVVRSHMKSYTHCALHMLCVSILCDTATLYTPRCMSCSTSCFLVAQ